jgi:putative glutamine amidotransferase
VLGKLGHEGMLDAWQTARVTTPLIAITTYPADDSADRINLPPEYVDCVRRAGGRAVLVPPGEPDVRGLLDNVDGVLLTGGGDIDPSLWDGPAHETVYMTSIVRDSMEIELARLAVERATPLLAICRGMQVLNVALGGTLHVHVPDVVGDSVTHRLPPPGGVVHPGWKGATPHSVSVEPSSRLADVLCATEVEPMSWHHQAVDRLGEGLRAVAWAPDGIVESIELDGHPSLFAVQWHPELTAADDPTQARLFETFVSAAAAVHA